MKKQERVCIEKYIKDFSFTLTYEEFDNQIKFKILKNDVACKALFNKYEQNQRELKDAIIDECEKWIEELKDNSNYHLTSDSFFVFTEEKFIYELSFSDS